MPDCQLKLRLAGHPQDCDFLSEAIAKSIALHFKVKARLEVKPESVSRAEVPGQAKRSVGRNRSLAKDNLVNPSRRHADILSEAILRNAPGLKEISQENFTGMNRREFAVAMVTSPQW
jgi:hypothetical protein